MRPASYAAWRLASLIVALLIAGCSGGAKISPPAQGAHQEQTQARTPQDLPNSKDQCKDGGWQTFGVFKNQGQCVAYIEHHRDGSTAPNVYVADYGHNAVKVILASSSYTTVNTLATGYNATGVAVDASGNVYMADNGSGSSGGGVFEILSSGGSIPPSPAINSIGSGLVAPFGIALDTAGNVFVAGYGDSLVKELLAPSFTTINVLGSGFNSPDGIAVDASGNVYVSDAQNGAVKEIEAVGGVIPPNPTIRTLASITLPVSVAVDSSGNVYFTEVGTHTVREILAVGGVIPVTPTINTLGSGFVYPTAVAVDSAGNVFVSDYGANAIKEMIAVGGSIPANPTINILGSGFAGPYGIALH